MTAVVYRQINATEACAGQFARATRAGSNVDMFQHAHSDGRRRSVLGALINDARNCLQFVLDTITSALIAAILLVFGLAFAALMVVAITVVLTCGLACYA
jgi:hypothetical protein